MLSNKTMSFLKDLKKNNSRDWFNKNKARYEEANNEFKEFVGKLIREVAKFEKGVANLEPKDCAFRIYRDVRFSKDKSPYKNHFGAHIIAGGKKMEMNRAGYYMHLSPGECFLAGGAHMPPSEWINAIRKEIHYNAKELKKIINHKDFKKYFGKITGEKLSSVPRGYDKTHPEIELLKHKSFLAVHNMKESQVTSKDFLSHAAKVFKAMQPFDKFLNQSMD
ncbi:MAG: DUF2461 domain-containing protein [Bacteroidetes bacterium]|nr:DUF2461 domain-containing protein [Bacteroidota bacterium]